jgi:acetylornithine deacetylase/succinyl-diaminopimelate desuccinylase-like protein
MGITERLAELVAIDTQNPMGDDRPACRKLKVDLEELGADEVVTEEVGRTGFVYARFGHAPSLLLNAHVDTVPANAGYTSPPHELVRRGDRLYGLGSADTKGAIAAILEALSSLRSAGGAIAPVAILFSGDEERGGAALQAFLKGPLRASLKRAIVCEPTRCRIGSRHRGVAAATAEVRGEGGHSSAVDHLVNPLAVLARAAVVLDDLGVAERLTGPPGFEGLCLNIAGLDGGVAFNVVPTAATLTVSIRPGPGRALDALLAELESRVRRAAAPLDVTWKILLANHPFATRDLSSFRPPLGDLVDHPIDLPFWSEAAVLSENGIDAVVFGPGSIEQAHAADEYVELGQLEQAFRVFRSTLAAPP